jgi:co-chaperonin GroES (HSP10)
VNFRPLGDRVLIRPEKPSDISDGGIHLVEARKPDECGEIVAVGESRHPRKEEAETLANFLDGEERCVCDGTGCQVCEAATLLRDLVRKEPCVKVGDTVLFSWASGQEITVDDGKETYLLMRESDLLAVLED